MLFVKPLCSIVLLPFSATLTNLILFIFHVPNTAVLLFTAVFPKLCAAEEAEVCRECFMFWQNLLYVTSLPLQVCEE